jgi:cytochrome P450
MTQLLSDDHYKDNDLIILHELLTFIGAATQTTTFLTTNFLYYMTKNQEIREKLVQELKSKLLSKLPKNADISLTRTWQDLIL